MQEKYSAKDYVDAVASEIDEAAKASLEANRTLVETLQNLEGDLLPFFKNADFPVVCPDGINRIAF